ncbi:hypothetical protein L9F63_006238, partial [Diploptera punctata]
GKIQISPCKTQRIRNRESRVMCESRRDFFRHTFSTVRIACQDLTWDNHVILKNTTNSG